MENYLYEQQWHIGPQAAPIRVGMVVKLGSYEVNAYKAGTGEHYMLQPGAMGRLVAMFLDMGVNEDADPMCVGRLDHGDQVLCCGQDIAGWGVGVP